MSATKQRWRARQRAAMAGHHDDAEALVVDPADWRGHKSVYITAVQTAALADALGDRRWERALDFGCGLGRLTRWLAARADRAIGLDVDPDLLRRAVARAESPPNVGYVRYGGDILPFAAAAFDLVVSVAVLQEIDAGPFETLAAELARCARPGGTIALIEQVRRRRDDWRRTLPDYTAPFVGAGCRLADTRPIRQSRWPLLLPIRQGLVPRRLFGPIGRLERAATARGIELAPVYVDQLVVFETPRDPRAGTPP